MKVGIITLGCKVNLYESEYVISLLKERGYEVVPSHEKCDIYIINTCTVTNMSDAKSRKVIRQARRRNQDACIVAMGCFIEANRTISMDEIDIYIGNKNKSKVVDYIEEWIRDKTKTKKLENMPYLTFEDMEIDTFEGRTRAFVKIQDGCENFCSYCIIPHVRGKCRSKKPETVIKEIKRLVEKGYKEIVLTGIHTGNYGVDLNTNFATILKEIVGVKGLSRLRISSIEITELTSDVLDIIKNNSVIVDHLHIPLQAGSNEILSLMNRKYDKKYFLDKVKEIRSIRPNISLTTDVIVGFPGETEELFQESLDFIREINFTKVHVFPYSIRENTPASLMKNQVDESIKKDRVKRLLALSKELELSYMGKNITKKVTVLIETSNKENESIGHTSNYLLVKTTGNYQSGEMITVEITNISYPYCIGFVDKKENNNDN